VQVTDEADVYVVCAHFGPRDVRWEPKLPAHACVGAVAGAHVRMVFSFCFCGGLSLSSPLFSFLPLFHAVLPPPLFLTLFFLRLLPFSYAA
jgi:hypothetical protein